MATYKEIKGVTVQTLDEDPVVNAGSWSSGGSMNTARSAKQSSGTGSDNAIVAGGYLATASPARQTACEVYNGTAWTEVAEANTARMFGQGGGTSTAAIISGGDTTATPPYQGITETWNGSSWTEVADMNTGRVGHFLTGVTTAAIVGGAYPASTSVESWNGSSWTEASYDLNTAKTYMWGTGTSTAAIVSGQPNTVEQFNGSNWTEVAETNTDHREGGSGGISTDALVWGGEPGYTVNTELWDNSSWTEQNNLSTGRSYVGATENAPSTTTALAYGGSSPAQVASTEEWGFPPATQAKLKEGMIFLSGGTTLKGFGKNAGIPAATWSSGGSMNTGRSNHFALGGLNDNLVTSPQGVVTTEQYNGTSWTALSSPANSGEGRAEGGSAGTSAAGVIFGGWEPGASALTELWNGSSWTETADLNTGRNELAGFGTSTAAFGAGGRPPGNTLVESWDGTSWTETTEINTGRGNMGGSGTTTDGLIFGGNNPNNANAEKWDGSAWTEVGDLNTARRYGAAGGGVGPISIYAGGYTGSSSAVVESWNGSSWTEINDLSSADYSTKGAPAGTNISTIVTGGGESNTTTEEFTADLTLAAITVS